MGSLNFKSLRELYSNKKRKNRANVGTFSMLLLPVGDLNNCCLSADFPRLLSGYLILRMRLDVEKDWVIWRKNAKITWGLSNVSEATTVLEINSLKFTQRSNLMWR